MADKVPMVVDWQESSGSNPLCESMGPNIFALLGVRVAVYSGTLEPPEVEQVWLPAESVAEQGDRIRLLGAHVREAVARRQIDPVRIGGLSIFRLCADPRQHAEPRLEHHISAVVRHDDTKVIPSIVPLTEFTPSGDKGIGSVPMSEVNPMPTALFLPGTLINLKMNPIRKFSYTAANFTSHRHPPMMVALGGTEISVNEDFEVIPPHIAEKGEIFA